MIDFFALGLVLVGCFIGGFGSLLVKKGSTEFSLRRLWLAWKNKFLVLGFLLYAFSLIFYMLALRWEDLTVLYPLVSTTYIWTSLLSVKFLGEKMNKWKGLALVGIVLGIVLIGLGS